VWRGSIDIRLGRGRIRRAGVDNSADLLAIAAASVPGACFVNASIYDYAISGCEAIVANGEPLTYHGEIADADRRVHDFLQRLAATLPPGGMLIFDVIETGEPSLAGRFWTSGTDWAVLAETTEDQSSRTLVRMIETFRQVGDLYRRGQELHRVRLFDTKELLVLLARYGYAAETVQAYRSERLLPRRRAFICTRS
jgi:hypothetical protein